MPTDALALQRLHRAEMTSYRVSQKRKCLPLAVR
jgi:hypothetical protein